MAKARTEAALEAALRGRLEPLNNVEVQRICLAADCSSATFYKSAAVRDFRARLAGPAPRATKGTKETMTKLRATIKVLANCVQALALALERQEQELAALRQRAHSNVTAFPDPSRRSRRGNASG